MIYKVKGKLISKDGGKVAVDLGGIAFELLLSMNSYMQTPALGGDVDLFTHFVMREDGAFLYGFTTMEEKELFLQLNTVSKIGPKMALAILGNVGKDELSTAVASQDVLRLSKVPGIGKKTAERIIVELKDKIKPLGAEAVAYSGVRTVKTDVVSALINLGYKAADCESLVSGFDDNEEFGVMLKKALSKIAG